jgi:flagellar hook assembly protein FlgD
MCTDDCNRNPYSQACIDGCEHNPGACKQFCRDNAYLTGCKCVLNPSDPSCGGEVGPCRQPPGVNYYVLPGSQCHGTVLVDACLDGCPGDTATVGGHPLSVPDNLCYPFTLSNVGSGGVTVEECVNVPPRDPPDPRCTKKEITKGFCRGDPSFMGGDLTDVTLPTGSRLILPVFSPGVPGSPHPVFNGSYQVIDATASVSIAIRDASQALVRTLSTDSIAFQGANTFVWDGKNDQGNLLPEGNYTYTVTQRDIVNPAEFNIQSGQVAIDNTFPVAQFSQISLYGFDTNKLQINGTASDLHFAYYTLGLSTGPGGVVSPVSSSSASVTAGSLGVLDTTSLADGGYLLTLTAGDAGGLVSTVSEPVTVSHVAGTGVRLILGATQQTVLNAEVTSSTAIIVDNPASFIDDGLPANVLSFNWSNVNSPVYSGALSHTDVFADAYPGARLHYFAAANPGYSLTPGDNIIQYVYIDPTSHPSEILLGFYTGQGDGEHRVYWGQNLIQTGGVDGSPSLLRMGDRPPVGQWIRLKIPASAVGLDGATIKGVVYGAYGGRATWDKTTSSHPLQDSQASNAEVSPPPPPIIQTNTTVVYTLPKAANIRIDVLRKSDESLVKNLFNGFQSSGTWNQAWDQTDSQGQVTPEGDYFFRFTSPDGPIDSEAIVLGGTTTFSGTFVAAVPDADNNLYTLNVSSGEIVKTTPAGYFMTAFGQGQLNMPTGLSLDAAGNVLAQDSGGVERFEVGRQDFNTRTLTAEIDVPWSRALVKGTVPIFGKAYGKDFSSYSVSIAPTWIPSSFTVINQSSSPATSFTVPQGQQTIYGNLATWETGLVPTEEYPVTDLFHPPKDLGYRGRWTIHLDVATKDNQHAAGDSRVVIGRVINNGTGGLIVSDDGKASIQVPPLSIQNDWDIFGLVTATTTPPAQMPVLPPNLIPVSAIYQLIPGSYAFLKPTTFQIALSTRDWSGNPQQVSLEQYNPNTGKWDVVPVTRNVVQDSSANVVGTMFTDAALIQVPPYDGYYGLFTSTATPAAPVLNPPASPTSNKEVLLSGIATPSSRVKIIFQQTPPAFSTTTILLGTDPSGLFSTNLYLSATGQYQIAATATDPYGNQSAPSAPVNVSVIVTTPSYINSIAFMNPFFTSVSTGPLIRGGFLYLQMQAADIDATRPDVVYALLSSSVTNPTGIEVPLVQIDNTSPVYRAIARLGNLSNESTLTLAARTAGERITAAAEANPLVSASLSMGDSPSVGAPAIFSPTHPSAFQDTFENGIDQWANYNSATGAFVYPDSTTVSSGQYSLKLKQFALEGDFSAVIHQTPFDVRQYPAVDFDYRMDPALTPPVNLYFRYQNIWHEVTLTGGKIDLPPSYSHLGTEANQIQKDKQWHSAEFNLLNFFKDLYPQTTSFVVDEVILGSWAQEKYFGVAPANVFSPSEINLDNFRIRSSAQANSRAVFEWTYPTQDIAGFSYAVDTSPYTVPPPVSLT